MTAMASGIVFGLSFAVLGVIVSHSLATFLVHGETTELGDAVLAMFVFLSSLAVGFTAVLSGIYGIARMRTLPPILITLLAVSINVVGFIVPTGGHAMLPFYLSLVVGIGLTTIVLGAKRWPRC
jgi:hypothetical protein